MTNTSTTILICTHNGEETIAAAVESALDQETQWPFEVLVIDDGCTDSTVSKAVMPISRTNGKRIRLNGFPKNQGLAKACNLGLKVAKGRFVIRLDDDDLLMPNALELMCPQTLYGSLVYCDRAVVDIGTGTKHRHVVGHPSSKGWLPRLSACGVMMLRDSLLGIGGYRDMFWGEYDLYLRYLENFGTVTRYVPEPLYICAARPGGEIPSSATMRAGWRELAGIWGEDKLRGLGFDLPGVHISPTGAS